MYSRNRNPILRTDSYKPTHWPQYPPGTTQVSSYMAARHTKLPIDYVIAFGAINYHITEFLMQRITMAHVGRAESLLAKHFGNPDLFNRKGFERIVNEHNGAWPVIVRFAREGTKVKLGRPIMFIENTDPELPWVTNYIESVMLKTWYPITVATVSHLCKQIILKWLEKNGDPSLIPFKLHDFGFRGASSDESAELGGMAHLVNFMGTDTLPALDMADVLYGEEMAGYSIPATEHSTITTWGREFELDAYLNVLKKYPKGLVACVSDSYNIYNACEHLWGGALREEVLAREGTLVVRPDSGDPLQVLPKVLDILGAKFGFTVNQKGYKVLDPHVRVIQGDGINVNSIGPILATLDEHGWSADNIAFGMGGGLLQQVNRDTFGFALKCCEVIIDGEPRDVVKQPVDDSQKSSLGISDMWEEVCDLPIVYADGRAHNLSTFKQIRERAV